MGDSIILEQFIEAKQKEAGQAILDKSNKFLDSVAGSAVFIEKKFVNPDITYRQIFSEKNQNHENYTNNKEQYEQAIAYFYYYIGMNVIAVRILIELKKEYADCKIASAFCSCYNAANNQERNELCDLIANAGDIIINYFIDKINDTRLINNIEQAKLRCRETKCKEMERQLKITHEINQQQAKQLEELELERDELRQKYGIMKANYETMKQDYDKVSTALALLVVNHSVDSVPKIPSVVGGWQAASNGVSCQAASNGVSWQDTSSGVSWQDAPKAVYLESVTIANCTFADQPTMVWNAVGFTNPHTGVKCLFDIREETKPINDQPTTDQPASELITEQSTDAKEETKPTTDQPASQPTTDQPASQPTTDQPASQPTTDQPASQPTTEQSTDAKEETKPTTEQSTDAKEETEPNAEQSTDIKTKINTLLSSMKNWLQEAERLGIKISDDFVVIDD